MIEAQAFWFMGIAAAIGLVNLLLGLFGMKLKTASLVATEIVELLVIAQLFVAIVVLAGGAKTTGSIFEFFGYLLVALLVPAGAAVFAIAEKSKNATIILGLAGLTISIMLLRMWTIWNS
ncbi:MAG: hypothetical protein RL488_527 [Actinomycetota bacterium]